MRWEEKHRPRKFSAVWGQDHAVRQLSGLVRSGSDRHVGLFGAVGSGKTSMIRLYAEGLNCLSVEADGSPCGTCQFCQEPKLYLHEYDTAGRSGSKDDVLNFVRAKTSGFGISKAQVIFFDEAHALSPSAQDGLLIAIQEARQGLIFCVATTERKRLKAALLSRLHDIDIWELSPEVGFEYLESIAKKEELSFDPQALRLLAAARPPYARDLVVALEGLSHYDQHIDANLVKKRYDLGVCDHLSRYSAALAAGDRAEQLRTLSAWAAGAAEKRTWIELFICSTYYNNVLGEAYIVDRLIDYLAGARQRFVELLQARLGVDTQGFTAAFERMMEFWSLREHGTDSEASLAIALFGALVRRDLVTASTDSLVAEPCKGVVLGINVDVSQIERPSAPTSRFLDADDLRQILNRTSFFVQHYGKPMNVSVCIEFAGPGQDLEASSEQRVAMLLEQLERRSGGAATFAGLAVLERDGGSLVGRFAAYVEEDQRDDFEALCRNVDSSSSRCRDFRTCPTSMSATFHTDAVRDLCAGYEPQDVNETADLRRKLRIPRAIWRSPGPTGCRHLFFSDRLGASAIDAACFPDMAPLSAFDAGAWSWFARGWEKKEYFDRRAELDRRKRELVSLERSWKRDPERLEREVSERRQSWRLIKPERRARRWQGWW